MIKLTTKTTVTHEEIAHYAYLLWEAEGKLEGKDVEYWVKAEQLLYSSEAAGQNGAVTGECVETVAKPAAKKKAKATSTASVTKAKKPRAATKKPKASKGKTSDTKAKAAKAHKAPAKKASAPKKAAKKKAVVKG